VPLHTKFVLIINGQASSQEESYGFFKFSRKNWTQNEILSPNNSVDENFFNVSDAPNITSIIDGDSYCEEIEMFPDLAVAPLIGRWWDNLKDDQLKEVPCSAFWSANQVGAVDLKLTGNIGCDKNQWLFGYQEWQWNPKRTRNGDVISVSLDLSITIVNDQDQPEPAL